MQFTSEWQGLAMEVPEEELAPLVREAENVGREVVWGLVTSQERMNSMAGMRERSQVSRQVLQVAGPNALQGETAQPGAIHNIGQYYALTE